MNFYKFKDNKLTPPNFSRALNFYKICQIRLVGNEGPHLFFEL